MLESGVYSKDNMNIIPVISEILESRPTKNIGSIVTFLGITRMEGLDGKKVDIIEIESYEEHANTTLRKICKEVKEKYDVSSVCIYHLVGKFKVGEPLVLVAIAGRSRRQTVDALEEAIKRYKTEPAIWKKEIYEDGTSQWVRQT